MPSAASADTVQVVYNVGLVESQTPPPGTVVAPGGNATIRVYVPPPAGCF